MKHLRIAASLLLMLPGPFALAQQAGTTLSDTMLLKQYILILASDDMEGRETGTQGEKLAYEYISGAFRNAGLLPKGSIGYIVPFQFNSGSSMGTKNTLKINQKT